MARLIVISKQNSWSCGNWIAHFIFRSIHSFLPQRDAYQLVQELEDFQDKRYADISNLSVEDFNTVYWASRHAYEHLLETGKASDYFYHPDFKPSEGFVRRFNAKFQQLIRYMERDDRWVGDPPA